MECTIELPITVVAAIATATTENHLEKN